MKAVDDTLFCHEFYHYMEQWMVDPIPEMVSGPVFETRVFALVEKEFLEICKKENIKHG